MNITADQLFKLLPAIYRIRNAEQGGPLKALMTVLAEQGRVLEDDMTRLYENGFIETCDEWVVPYISDLLGVRGLHSISTEAAFSQRARVANTIRYRRRKGTATVLEQLAFDTTGWRARAVEFFELLGWTQHYNHIRPHNVRTPDLRQTSDLELLNTAFDKAPHTVDIRSIVLDRGRHNIMNIGLFVWRVQSYAVTRGTAREATPGGYTFSPLGYDMPLFNRPQTETEITHLAEEVNVPTPLRRRVLYDELEARRQAIVDGEEKSYLYFDDSEDSQAPPVFEIYLEGSSTPISPDEILICDLSNWHIPDNLEEYQHVESDGTITTTSLPISVAVDPVLGRITFPSTALITQSPLVSYAYGFSGDVGGGPYNRRDSVAEVLTRSVTWQVGVSKEIAAEPGVIFPTLSLAIAEWQLQPAGTVGVMTLLDSRTYEENLTGSNRIEIPEGSKLLIVAADWPNRALGKLDADEKRPHLLGNIEVIGTAAPESTVPGELILDGLLVEGKLTVLVGNLGQLGVAHSTFVLDKGGLEVVSDNEELTVTLSRTICGPISLKGGVDKLQAIESIVDNGSGIVIDASNAAADLEGCTLFGSVNVLSIEASECIFSEKVEAVRNQIGCVRFSYAPRVSKLPRRYHCQPDLALDGVDPVEHPIVEARIKPAFTSSQYGHYAYAQLSNFCAEEIRTGAEDGAEMGVFRFLKQPQRVANLRASLDEYLRLGLEAGIIYAT